MHTSEPAGAHLCAGRDIERRVALFPVLHPLVVGFDLRRAQVAQGTVNGTDWNVGPPVQILVGCLGPLPDAFLVGYTHRLADELLALGGSRPGYEAVYARLLYPCPHGGLLGVDGYDVRRRFGPARHVARDGVERAGFYLVV